MGNCGEDPMIPIPSWDRIPGIRSNVVQSSTVLEFHTL